MGGGGQYIKKKKGKREGRCDESKSEGGEIVVKPPKGEERVCSTSASPPYRFFWRLVKKDQARGRRVSLGKAIGMESAHHEERVFFYHRKARGQK